MNKITVTQPFITTRNVRNFDVMMDGLAMAEGEGRFGLVYSEAGRGKSRTVKTWHANNTNSIYLLAQKVWKTNYTDFLRNLCVELGIRPAPKRKGDCFESAINALLEYPRTVIIDEIEKLPNDFLEITRDLAELTGGGVVLVGEEELASHMRLNRRVWSRTFQRVEFSGIGAGDIMMYIKDATRDAGKAGFPGLVPGAESAALIHRLTQGNFREIRRLTINLAKICNDKKTVDITEQMVKAAHKLGLSGNAS